MAMYDNTNKQYSNHASCMETCKMEKPCGNDYCSANPNYLRRKAADASGNSIAKKESIFK